jgi:hypothetical protein
MVRATRLATCAWSWTHPLKIIECGGFGLSEEGNPPISVIMRMAVRLPQPTGQDPAGAPRRLGATLRSGKLVDAPRGPRSNPVRVAEWQTR